MKGSEDFKHHIHWRVAAAEVAALPAELGVGTRSLADPTSKVTASFASREKLVALTNMRSRPLLRENGASIGK